MTSILNFRTVIALGMTPRRSCSMEGSPADDWLHYGLIGRFIAIPYLLTQTSLPGGRNRTALLYFVAAVIVFALVLLLFTYRLQNASPV